MDYINSSVRKLGSLFSSPLPASTLGKRKADDDSDSDASVYEQLHSKRQSLEPSLSDEEHTGEPTTHPRAEFPGVDDSYIGVGASNEASNDYDYPVPQPPQRRNKKPTTPDARSVLTTQANVATEQADQAMRKAREAMGKPQPAEQEIQDELGRQQRQDEHDQKTLAEYSKRKLTKNTGELFVVGPDERRHVSGTSKPNPVSELSVSRWNKEQWTIQPNRRARDLLGDHGHDAAAMLKSLQEPAYVCRDAEIRDGVEKMVEQIQDFAETHFSFTVSDQKVLRPALKSMAKETVKIIGCVASGGPAGAEGWEDLFLAADKRQALVCAIIGNVIVEQVLQHIFFGGTEAQIEAVAAIQFDHRHKDGFDRNALYARKIHSFLTSTSSKGKAPIDHPTSTLRLPANFNAHVNHTTAALYTHLKPLLSLHHLPALNPSLSTPSNQSSINLTQTFPALHALVTHAALLSLHMRLDAHTAYHLAPVFKDTRFSTQEMTCLNHSAMLATHPQASDLAHAISPAEQTRRMKSDSGLVQICLFPSVTALRSGGWEKSASTREQRVYEDGGREGMGFRERRLTRAWVYCRWGRRRVWARGAPADEPATHGVAWRGGFVEFFPGVQGVRDPHPERAAAREKASEMSVGEGRVGDARDVVKEGLQTAGGG